MFNVIANSSLKSLFIGSSDYPTSMLSKLLDALVLWEKHCVRHATLEDTLSQLLEYSLSLRLLLLFGLLLDSGEKPTECAGSS